MIKVVLVFAIFNSFYSQKFSIFRERSTTANSASTKMFSFHSMVDGFEAEVCFILLANVTQGVRNIELKTL